MFKNDYCTCDKIDKKKISCVACGKYYCPGCLVDYYRDKENNHMICKTCLDKAQLKHYRKEKRGWEGYTK
jgi:hypothetical protein